MNHSTKRVRPRKTLTSINVFKKLQCKMPDFFEKTGHQYAVIKWENDEADTIDLANIPDIYGNVVLSYVGETTRAQIDRIQNNAGAANVNLCILEGFCVNLSDYPIAIFHGTIHVEATNDKNIIVYVPCYWE